MGLTDAEELELQRRLTTGSASVRRAVVDALFVSLRGRVFALCRNLSSSRTAAEDAVQETFLQLHRSLASFRGEAQLETFVYRIALRTTLRLRAAHRVPSAPIEEASRVPADAPLPDAVAGSRQLAARVTEALGQLSAEHQAVLALFAVEGLGHQEIADVLGIPVGTVWSRLHGARKRLTERLGAP